MLPIADDIGWVAPGSGDEFVADNQQTEVVAGQKPFDDYFVADVVGDVKGGFDLLCGLQVHGNAFALIAIAGLNNNWSANPFGCLECAFQRGDDTALRHSHAG